MNSLNLMSSGLQVLVHASSITLFNWMRFQAWKRSNFFVVGLCVFLTFNLCSFQLLFWLKNSHWDSNPCIQPWKLCLRPQGTALSLLKSYPNSSNLKGTFSKLPKSCQIFLATFPLPQYCYKLGHASKPRLWSSLPKSLPMQMSSVYFS